MTKYPYFGDLSQKNGWLVFGIVLFGSLAFLAFQVKMWRSGLRRDWIALAWGISMISVLLSRRMAGGERYQLVACTILGLLVVVSLLDERLSVKWRRVAACLLVVGGIAQTYLWFARMGDVYDPSWPKWREEVAAWKNGEREELLVHPQWQDGSWKVRLPKPD
jgi:hypothetical protein